VALDRVIERRTQREHVRRGCRVRATGQLGGQVGRGTADQPGGGQRHVALGTGDTEVGELGHPGVVDQDVARLDVAVHDARLVCGVQCAGHLLADARDLRHREGAALGDQLRQALGLQVLHHQARVALVLGDVEHHDGVRVLQAGGVLGFAHGPRVQLGPVGGRHAVLADHPLDRYRTLQTLVDGAPDHAHGTGADVFDESVVPSDKLPGFDGEFSLAR